jgi:hypothetical protein
VARVASNSALSAKFGPTEGRTIQAAEAFHMDAPSELESFLKEQTDVGAPIGEGRFTLAREEALRKIAAFQLAFANAWVLKLVQSAVATRSQAPIKVDLASRELRFHFSLSGLSLDQVEAAFHDPEPSSNLALRHLLSGLWSVGLKEGWPFQLRLGEWEESLVWNGKALSRLPVTRPVSDAVLTVAFVKQDAGVLNWVKQVSLAGRRNADLSATFQDLCYTCPVPLTVDGRRLDSLYHCPSHCPTVRDHLITLGFAHYPDPAELKIPPGTFEMKPIPKGVQSFWTLDTSHPKDSAGLDKVSKKVLKKTPRVEACPAPFLLIAHRGYFAKGRSPGWGDRAEASIAYWVRDGVIVDQEVFESSNSVSLAVFLSAEGLKADMSSFSLADEGARFRRLDLARRGVAESLESLPILDESLVETLDESKLKSRILAGGMMVAGAAGLWVLPVLGAGVMGQAGYVLAVAGTSQKRSNEKLRTSIDYLKGQLLQRAFQSDSGG